MYQRTWVGRDPEAGVADPVSVHADRLREVQRARVPNDDLGSSLRRWLRAPAEREATAAETQSETRVGRVTDGVVIGPERLRRLRSLGAGDHSLDGPPNVSVGMHRGDSSGVLAELGAEALTDGAVVHFSEPDFQPDTTSGSALARHELAHVAQTGGLPSARVQLKLRGSAAAVREAGGGPSAKAWLNSSSWKNVLSSLDTYEALEKKILKRGSFKKRELDGLEKSLHATRAHSTQWLADHRAAFDPLAEKQADPAADQRTGVLQALLRRLVAEERELAAARLNPTGYFDHGGYNDKTVRPEATGAERLPVDGSRDRAVGGAMNKLDWVVHDTKTGTERGFFIPERLRGEASNAGADSGIPADDPNGGGRSLATYRLAELLGAGNRFAKISMASHASPAEEGKKSAPRLGVHSESVDGDEVASKSWALSDAQRGPDDLSLADPVLQEQLNIIQVIDYIARQVDRHWHNMFVSSHGGQVTGVTGIDFDQSFGADTEAWHQGADGALKPESHFVGLPDLIDAGFARTLSAVTEKQVRDALDGLITPTEVDATVARFATVQARIGALTAPAADGGGGGGAADAGAPRQRLIDRWDDVTSIQQQATVGGSYISIIRQAATDQALPKELLEQAEAGLGPLEKLGPWLRQHVVGTISAEIGAAGISIADARDMMTHLIEVVVHELGGPEAAIATDISRKASASEVLQQAVVDTKIEVSALEQQGGAGLSARQDELAALALRQAADEKEWRDELDALSSRLLDLVARAIAQLKKLLAGDDTALDPRARVPVGVGAGANGRNVE